ncbi:PAS/PAC sensor hybrid histidine kinase [Roseimicrobium gellanilyticum]|uniref:histidine kinase n=1 Tax=Roseimicrobium gellanilyticum TaxID=748857 RepID=A0A366HDY3_9BACT|nr:response regulator [Roseimicrobium gellanilyticum]RBP40587.1 PAS/PAC sensor hybrid histidine kinase [Roseimicrobium gellanilyticum]
MTTTTPGINILLVDDDLKNLMVLETILDAPDHRLIKATTPEEALMTLMSEPCAAIILDVQMPGMSGIELAQLIKQRRKTQNIPIIFLTAHYYEEEHIVLGYGAGAVDYITKPVNPDILRSKVSVFVELYRKTDALTKLNDTLQAEIQERHAAEERFRFVVESSPTAMVVTGQDEKIVLVNSRAESLFGFSREELLGESIRMLIPEGLADDLSTDPRANSGEPVELEVRRKDAGKVPVEVGLSQFEASSGAFHIASLVDITFRKQVEAALMATNRELAIKNAELERAAEERTKRILAEAARAEAEAANQAKDRFLAMLSHELRTPLSPVLHAVAIIREEYQVDKGIRELLDTIQRNVQLEARLIDDLLDLARIRNGKMQLHLENVDLHTLVQRAVEICHPELQRKNIQLKLNLEARNSHSVADAARIQQIFCNLIGNAIKFSPPSSSISINSANADDEKTVQIRFEDVGEGIAPERINRIFDAFEQAHGDRSTGLGLGLAICRALVEGHRGSITASSGGPGRGSVFIVGLPTAAERVTTERTPTRPEKDSPASLRLLVVEDHQDTAVQLKRLLTRRGYAVELASSVESGMALIRDSSFDVLVSDIGLPDGEGLQLMQPFIRAAGERQIGGIALSGYGMAEDIAQSERAGFDFHLTKPVDIGELDKCLHTLAAKVQPVGGRAS